MFCIMNGCSASFFYINVTCYKIDILLSKVVEAGTFREYTPD